jgi:hypothetical protein
MPTKRGYLEGSLTHLVVEELEDAGTPLSTGELMAAALRRGYRHRGTPRNPEQLRFSISSLPHKTRVVRRVGRGLYGLAGRDAP